MVVTLSKKAEITAVMVHKMSVNNHKLPFEIL